MHRRVLVCLGLAGLLAACSQGSPGAMGQARFSTDCAPTDQACLAAGLRAPIAVGGQLRLEVASSYAGAAALALTLEPVDPTVLAVSGTRLRGLREGVVALLVTAPGRRVMDFIHVSVRAPSRIGIHRLGAEGTDLGQVDGRVQLVTGDKLALDIRPYDGERPLMGQVPAAWSVSGAAVTLLETGLGSRRELVAAAAGTSRVTVTSAGNKAHVDLEVLP